MKNVRNIMFFLAIVCGSTGVVAMDKDQKKQQQLKRIDFKIQQIRKRAETLSVGLQPIHVKKINKLELQRQRIQPNMDMKNLRSSNLLKSGTHKTKLKKIKKSPAHKRRFQASPDRNKMIFHCLLHQAKNQLHDDNKMADQKYEEKTSWKMKDVLKQQRAIEKKQNSIKHFARNSSRK